MNSDHDLLMQIHERIFNCATKDDVRDIAMLVGTSCVSEHERRCHGDAEISISAKGGSKLFTALIALVVAAVTTILAKLGIGI